LPWLYVGETSIEPEERIEQHRTAARNSRGPLFSRRAYRYFVRPRPDLYERIPPVHSRKESQVREALVASTLSAQGFSVISN
jgi:hypothetical protein